MQRGGSSVRWRIWNWMTDVTWLLVNYPAGASLRSGWETRWQLDYQFGVGKTLFESIVSFQAGWQLQGPYLWPSLGVGFLALICLSDLLPYQLFIKISCVGLLKHLPQCSGSHTNLLATVRTDMMKWEAKSNMRREKESLFSPQLTYVDSCKEWDDWQEEIVISLKFTNLHIEANFREVWTLFWLGILYEPWRTSVM